MNKVWSWVLSAAIVLIILSFLTSGRSNRQNYWVARGAMSPQVVVVQAPSDLVQQRHLHHWFER
jgi:hypothetical protein